MMIMIQNNWTNVFWIIEWECHRNAACTLCSSDRRHAEHSNVCTLTFCTVIHHVLYVQCCWGKWPVSATVYLQPAAAHESPMRLFMSSLPLPAHDEVCLASFIERTMEINSSPFQTGDQKQWLVCFSFTCAVALQMDSRSHLCACDIWKSRHFCHCLCMASQF